MSVQMAAFAFGCFLMMVALLGGGFQVKELHVPKVGRIPRVTSCAFSLLFLFLGVRPDFLGGGGAAPAAARPPAAAPAAAVPPAPQPQVVERIVERPVLIPTPVPVASPPQALPAQEVAAPQAAPSGTAQKKRETRPAASPQAKKKVPWEQKPRRWLNRVKEARG